MRTILITFCVLFLGVAAKAQYSTELYQKAFSGDPIAMNQLGLAYYQGDEIAQDYEKAFECFNRAANDLFYPSSDAMYMLSNCYRFGRGTTQDLEKAEYWLKMAQETGNDEANNIMLLLGQDLRSMPQMINTAAQMNIRNELLEAAKNGDSEAMYLIGCEFEEYQNFVYALAWFQKAAENDYAPAMFTIGSYYEEGKGVPQNNKTAALWYRKAAESGFVFAQFRIGMFYENGVGVKQDYTQAMKWYSKAAEQNNEAAQYFIGRFYLESKGVEKDYQLAYDWFSKSNSNGCIPAVAQLGEMYYYGCYVTQSFEQAFELFKKAAEASNNASGDAMYMLSNCYRFGRGTTQDLEKAEYWLKKSQEAGNDKANIIKQLLGQ